MDAFLCLLDNFGRYLVMIYTGVLIVYALISWVPDLRGRWTDYLAMLVEPVLQPIRRVIPPIGGLDLAFMVLFILLTFVIGPLLYSQANNVCFQ